MFDGTLVNLLSEGKREIENALRWQGIDHKLVINIKETEYTKTEMDIQRLKTVFDSVIIKEFKG